MTGRAGAWVFGPSLRPTAVPWKLFFDVLDGGCSGQEKRRRGRGLRRSEMERSVGRSRGGAAGGARKTRRGRNHSHCDGGKIRDFEPQTFDDSEIRDQTLQESSLRRRKNDLRVDTREEIMDKCSGKANGLSCRRRAFFSPPSFCFQALLHLTLPPPLQNEQAQQLDGPSSGFHTRAAAAAANQHRSKELRSELSRLMRWGCDWCPSFCGVTLSPPTSRVFS